MGISLRRLQSHEWSSLVHENKSERESEEKKTFFHTALLHTHTMNISEKYNNLHLFFTRSTWNLKFSLYTGQHGDDIVFDSEIRDIYMRFGSCLCFLTKTVMLKCKNFTSCSLYGGIHENTISRSRVAFSTSVDWVSDDLLHPEFLKLIGNSVS